MLSDLHPCFGVLAFGMCAYDPGAPSPIYFSLGDAIAALGFTLAIQQLFKPIYQFRVRAYGLKMVYLPIAVFLGAICTVVAMVLPNLALFRNTLFAYPIFWELFGSLLIILAYAFVAVISFLPAQVYRFNLVSFCRAAAILLSEANEEDRIIFARDLLGGKNLERLIAYAGAWRAAEWASSRVIFEEKKRKGEKLEIIGPPPISAFYLFAHRRELDDASTAITLLRIISDPDFCATLVRKCSWLTAGALARLSDRHIHVADANSFVQEVARQALEADDGMLAKESAYTGFRSLPVLSKNLFGDWFILKSYNPLSAASLSVPENPSQNYVHRLGRASELMFKCMVRGQEYWQPDGLWAVKDIYESIGNKWSLLRYNSQKAEFQFQFSNGIEKIIEIVEEAFGSMEVTERGKFYLAEEENDRWHNGDIPGLAAEIAFDSLLCVANRFRGYEDDAWFHAQKTLSRSFERFGAQAEGLSPFQQRLAIQMRKKLSENMEGWYPALCRIMLSIMGPYEETGDKGRTAFNILKDVLYLELQKLSALAKEKPEKLADFLPDNVTYDPVANALTHNYRSGESRVTNLGDLKIDPVDLRDARNWATG